MASREWHVGPAAAVVLNLLGLGALVLGMLVYATAWSGGDASVTVDVTDLLLALPVTLALTAILVVTHEGVHGLAILALGGRPTFGATMIASAIPALYCTAPGTRFTRAGFLAVALAPLVLVGGLCLALVAWLPHGGWLVIPAAVHLSGCAGDLALAWVAARQPRGTLIEDLMTGVRLHDPAG